MTSMIFTFRNGKFEGKAAAQQKRNWRRAFGICVADVDGDGAEDLFLSQNFFAVASAETARADAGARACWLKGDGHGGLAARAGPDQPALAGLPAKDAAGAVADYDGDGRVDSRPLAQNANATRLYHKRWRATPGWRRCDLRDRRRIT